MFDFWKRAFAHVRTDVQISWLIQEDHLKMLVKFGHIEQMFIIVNVVAHMIADDLFHAYTILSPGRLSFFFFIKQMMSFYFVMLSSN